AQEIAVFGLVPEGGPIRVVAVLLAAALVEPSGLDMPTQIGANPHVPPRGRNRKGLDARKGLAVAQQRVVGQPIAEPAPGAPPPYARLAVAHIAQPVGAQMAAEQDLLHRQLDGKSPPLTWMACPVM